MAAGILNLKIEQGATFRQPLRIMNQRILTAIVDTAVTSKVGSTTVTFAPDGLGAIEVGDYLVFGSHTNKRAYRVTAGVADLEVGGDATLEVPLREIVNGGSVMVLYSASLTGAVFNSQIRSAANSADIAATITATLIQDVTGDWFELYMSAETTSAIPTVDKTDYSKLAKYTFDGELIIGGDTVRTYNGTVQVSPEVTRVLV